MRKSDALRYRSHIETAVQSLPASEALAVPSLHPKWEAGKVCEAGKRYYYGGKLYEALQAHTAQADWPPDTTTSLFAEVNESNAGTLADPIPYNGSMELTEGLYYSQDGVTYLCTRSTGQAVYNALSELVGLYVEVSTL